MTPGWWAKFLRYTTEWGVWLFIFWLQGQFDLSSFQGQWKIYQTSTGVDENNFLLSSKIAGSGAKFEAIIIINIIVISAVSYQSCENGGQHFWLHSFLFCRFKCCYGQLWFSTLSHPMKRSIGQLTPIPNDAGIVPKFEIVIITSGIHKPYL